MLFLFRSREEKARAQEEIERKLDDLDAAVDDAADRKPLSKDSNLVDLETSKTHVDRHKVCCHSLIMMKITVIKKQRNNYF